MAKKKPTPKKKTAATAKKVAPKKLRPVKAKSAKSVKPDKSATHSKHELGFRVAGAKKK